VFVLDTFGLPRVNFSDLVRRQGVTVVGFACSVQRSAWEEPEGYQMRVHRATITGCVAVLTLVLLACEMPRPPQGAGQAPAPPLTVRAGKVIDPGSAVLDLEQEGLQVWWRQQIGQIAEGKKLQDAYLLDNLLVVETRDATLFYFDATTGVWTGATRLKSLLMAPPAAYEKVLYVPCERALAVVDRESGQIQKRLRAMVPISCQPLAYYNFLILCGGNGQVLCMDTEEGGEMWRGHADGAIETPPLLYKENLYVAGFRGRVVAINAHSGIEVWGWRPNAPSTLASGLAIGEGFLYVGDNRGFVYSLLPEEPVVTWKYPAGAPVSSIAPVRGRLLVFTHGSDALCLDLNDEPPLRWKHADGQQLIATGKTDAYLLTRDGSVACVSLETGQEKWRLPLAEGCMVVSDSSKTAFYVLARDGAIMAIKELE